jgi:hypothetical protein
MHSYAQFPVPDLEVAKSLFAQVASSSDGSRESRQQVSLTCFDSFDWRLEGAGLHLLEEQGTGKKCRLTLDATGSKRRPLVLNTDKRQGIQPHQLPIGPIRKSLTQCLRGRALLSQVIIAVERHRLELLDSEDKVIARMLLEHHMPQDALGLMDADLGWRLQVQELKGYDHIYSHILELIARAGLEADPEEDMIERSMQSIGRHAGDYRFPPLLDPKLDDADHPAALLRSLTDVLERNLPGLRTELDSGFADDLRSACSMLELLCHQMSWPGETIGKWLGMFEQLRDQTAETDALLKLREDAKCSAGIDLASGSALHEAIQVALEIARERLSRGLVSHRLRKDLHDWKEGLSNLEPLNTHQPPYWNWLRSLSEELAAESPPDAGLPARLTALCGVLRSGYAPLPRALLTNLEEALTPLQESLSKVDCIATRQDAVQRLTGSDQAPMTSAAEEEANALLVRLSDGHSAAMEDFARIRQDSLIRIAAIIEKMEGLQNG